MNMGNTRKEKPDWFLLIDRIKAIAEVGMGDQHTCASFVGVAPARYFEWISGKVEPKAQTALLIQKWVGTVEAQIHAIPSKIEPYKKALANAKKS
jgi:hypothetical protein